MSFDNIPFELRALHQWVCWRLEFRPPMAKATKPCYIPRPNAGKASVDKPESWGSFEQASQAPMTCLEPVDPDTPIGESGYSGIGFVFTINDEYCGIDCDDTHGDVEAYNRQLKIFNDFNSYTELSPSGQGIHIIVKGKVPTGRRRASIELYPHGRFFTMTGNVINNVPIADRQELLEVLHEQMGGDVKNFVVSEDKEEKQTDEEVIAQATSAANGDKFAKLFKGDWQHDYASQSEADFALTDIVCFYTKHRLQYRRIFRQSALGQRDKAQRDDYLDYMFEKSFDRQLPLLDVDNLKQKLDDMLALHNKGGATAAVSATEPGRSSGEYTTAAAPTNAGTSGEARTVGAATMPHDLEGVNTFPPGLLGEVARFFLAAAPRPVPEIALAGAIGYLAGICGRAYNVSGTGLNQYILMLAPTGVGKEAIASGTSKLSNAVQVQVPSIVDFKGPGEIASAPALIKWLERKPCVFSILGEIGKKLKEMASPYASPHITGLSRALLQFYAKSGHNDVFDPMAYSDKEKNTIAIRSPALTILGESVPESFYESLDESLIADGLLPRFMVFEYKGDRSYLNKHAKTVLPPFDLVQKLGDFVAGCLTITNQQAVHEVKMLPDTEAKFDEFDKWTTDVINQSGGTDVHRQLWNRAHLKAMKLAALRAVGENPTNPIVNIEHCMWATNIVVAQTTKLIAKFETGMTGFVGGSEGKQIGEVIRVITDFVNSDYYKYAEKYGATFDMHKDGVIPESYISRRLIAVSCMRHDRMGATHAIKRAIKTLLEADEIREMPKSQMVEKYGSGPRSFVVSNPRRFMPRPAKS